jgi:hypothetical protein
MTPAAISGRSSVAVIRPRRRLRLFLILLVLVAAGLVAAYALAPMAASMWLRGELPKRTVFYHGEVVVSEAGSAIDLAYSGSRPELQLLIPPDCVGELAQQASGWWLPGGLARAGQHVEGTLTLRDLRDRAFSWQALVGGMGTSATACLVVQAVDLNHFLLASAQSSLPLIDHQVLRLTYVVDGAQIEDDDPPGHPSLERRSRVVAHGSIIVDAAGWRKVVQVRRLAGHAITTFTPTPAGLHLAMAIAIETPVDADLISLPLIGDLRPQLIKTLEDAANQGLKDGLEKVILPAWFPTGIRLAAEVLGDGGRPPAPPAPPAAAAPPAPPAQQAPPSPPAKRSPGEAL